MIGKGNRAAKLQYCYSEKTKVNRQPYKEITNCYCPIYHLFGKKILEVKKVLDGQDLKVVEFNQAKRLNNQTNFMRY